MGHGHVVTGWFPNAAGDIAQYNTATTAATTRSTSPAGVPSPWGSS
ncbi:hypothetical protein [Verrucomicrobium spinosum]|nr:hypothetical protein [Verrucomicrobium spinosum]